MFRIQSINQASKESVNERMNQSIYQSIISYVSDSINQSIKESVNEWTNESIYQSIISYVSDSINQSINQGISEWMNESINLSIHHQICFGFNQSINQGISEWMNEWINQSIISQLQKTNSRYDVKKWQQHIVMSLCCFCAIPQRWSFNVTTSRVRNAHRHIVCQLTVVVPLQAFQLVRDTHSCLTLDLY